MQSVENYNKYHSVIVTPGSSEAWETFFEKHDDVDHLVEHYFNWNDPEERYFDLDIFFKGSDEVFGLSEFLPDSAIVRDAEEILDDMFSESLV